MKGIRKQSLVAFALGMLTLGGLNLFLANKNQQSSGAQNYAPSNERETPPHPRSGERISFIRANPAKEKLRGFLSKASGGYQEAWKLIEESDLVLEEKTVVLGELLKELCDAGQFELGFELVTTMGYGERRTALIASLFGHPSIPVKQAFEASKSLATETERAMALSGISCALNSQGLEGSGMDANSVLALEIDQAEAFGSGIGRHLDLMDGSREFKSGVVKDDLSYFRSLAEHARTPSEKEKVDIAKYSYLSSASGVNSKLALEEFISEKFDQVSASREWKQAVHNAMNSLISRHPTEILEHLRTAEGPVSARLFGSAVGRWAERDLDAASTWMKSNTSDLDQAQIDSMASSLVQVSLRMGDKEGAKSWQTQIKDPQLAAATAGMVK